MSEYLGLKNDGTLYAAHDEELFIQKYKEKWAKTMSDTYFKSEQVDVGHKLRPRLVFWGYTSNADKIDEKKIENVAQIAVCIELIHKASLLLDDYIDKDTTRHSKPAFYVEYGPERTMIYCLNLLSKSLELVNKTYYNDGKFNSFYYKSINDITHTLQEMTVGVLHELDLSKQTIASLSEIRKIMDLETSSLITNSLLMGYYLTYKERPKLETILKRAGNNLGYIFQILNDLESFFSPKISEHKGSANNDISRGRKNICIPVLFELISAKEKGKITHTDGTLDELEILELMEKYHVKRIMLDEVEAMRNKTEHLILNDVEEYSRHNWGSEFVHFADSVVDVFKKRISV